ncbi:MAG: insulinase family protein [Gemmatimonadetes bacterium]|nr:insulinase family protein [Gemmatimonadota bacterium]
MESVRSVALGVWVRQGRIHESADEGGVSHLLEHMVFKGTERRSARELAWELERLGGSLDAYTTHEATAYHARVPAEDVCVAVDVLCDLVLHPLLRSSDLAIEREVVLEEIVSAEDDPEDVAFEHHARFLYDGHAYGEPIFGSRASVEALSIDTIRSVHERSYRPGNLVIAAAGAVDHEQIVDAFARRFPDEASAPPSNGLSAPVGVAGIRRVERAAARQTHIITGGLTVPYRDPLRYAIVVTSTALGGGMSSRLFQHIREERGLAYSVYSFQGFFAAMGHVGTYVGTRPEAADEARGALLTELSTFAANGLDDDELADTRGQLKGQILISLESPTARMNRLAGTAVYGHEYRSLDEVARRIDRVDLEGCRRAAAFFDPERSATLELVPAAD